MGVYLQPPQPILKAMQLEQLFDAERIERPEHWADIPADKYLVCVVENPTFDAVGVVYSESEFIHFSLPDDPSGRYPERRRTWLLIDRTRVEEQLPQLRTIRIDPPPPYLLDAAARYGVSH